MWGIELLRQREVSLKRQIYQTLRDQIINGRIEAGEVLPSTRELAKQLAVSRNTVCEAYEMLLAEGFILCRQGSPTRVAEGLYIDRSPGAEAYEEPSRHAQPILADFRTGQPDLRHFPRFQWYQILRKAYEEMPLSQLGYTGPEGLLHLREEIAAWLFRNKGLVINSQNIFVTAGSTHGLHLISDLLCRRRNAGTASHCGYSLWGGPKNIDGGPLSYGDVTGIPEQRISGISHSCGCTRASG